MSRGNPIVVNAQWLMAKPFFGIYSQYLATINFELHMYDLNVVKSLFVVHMLFWSAREN